MEGISIEKPSDFAKRPAYRETLDFSPAAGRKLKRVLAEYRFPNNNDVPCGISSCRTMHRSGFLVETDDGLETNIGNRCGQKHLGADFQLERGRFRAAGKRKRNLKAIEGFQDQAAEHQDRITKAVAAANEFWRFMRTLSREESQAMRLMAKMRKDRIDSQDRLQREDAKALHQQLEIKQPFGNWYRDSRPTVSDLKIRIPGISAVTYPFQDILVKQLQEPMTQLLAMSQQEIQGINDRALDQWRQKIQRAPHLMHEAEAALENARQLMGVDLRLLRFLPDVYPAAEE